MVEPAGTARVGVAVWGQALYHSWRPRRVGIYGAPLVGKTTLDRYMTTPGEMEAISDEDRTTHGRLLGVAGPYRMPSPTRKRISWNGDKRVVFSADIGGQERFWNLWIEDAVTRRVEAIVYMFDERAFKGGEDGLQQVGGFRFLVDRLVTRDYRYRSLRARLKGKRYHPKTCHACGNKADRFDDTASKLWHDGRIGGTRSSPLQRRPHSFAEGGHPNQAPFMTHWVERREDHARRADLM